jgi:hypothetical protein
METRTIYVYLLNEGTDVWAPVEAEHVAADTYRIISGSGYEDTDAEFQPGDMVLCRLRAFSDGEGLVAYARAS